jgi:hypothetical protein
MYRSRSFRAARVHYRLPNGIPRISGIPQAMQEARNATLDFRRQTNFLSSLHIGCLTFLSESMDIRKLYKFRLLSIVQDIKLRRITLSSEIHISVIYRQISGGLKVLTPT